MVYSAYDVTSSDLISKLPQWAYSAQCEDALAHRRAENSATQTYELELRINSCLSSVRTRRTRSRKTRPSHGLPSKLQSATGRRAAETGGRQLSPSSSGSESTTKRSSPIQPRIRRKTEGNRRVRFLSDKEEARLQKAIRDRFPELLPHLLFSIHTGMRMSEQYGLRGNQVDFERRQIHLPKTKNGGPRTIPLNAVALGALKDLKSSEKPRATEAVFHLLRAVLFRDRALVPHRAR